MWALSVLLLVAACDRSPAKPSPSPVPSLSLVECVANVVVHDALAAPYALTPLSDAMSLMMDVAPRREGRELVHAIVDAAEQAGVRPRAAVLSTGARWLAHLDDLDTARELARRARSALETEPDGRRDAANDLAFVLAWTGNLNDAVELAGDDPMAQLLAAEGAARAGNKGEAKRLLAERTFTDAMPRAVAIQAYAILGELASARALLDAIPDPAIRAYSEALFARTLVDAKHPTARDEVTSSLAEIMRVVETADGDARVTALTSSIDASGSLHDAGDAVGAARARQLIRSGIPADANATILKSQLATSAQLAGDTALADALLAELRDGIHPVQHVHVAVMREDFKTALELYPSIGEERGVAAVSVWGALVRRPRDPALVARFEALVCATRSRMLGRDQLQRPPAPLID